MNPYAAYDPYAAYRYPAAVAPVAPVVAPSYPIVPYYGASASPVYFGQAAPPAPAPAPGAMTTVRTFLQTPSVGGLSRGALLAIGVGAATLAYGASTGWWGLMDRGSRAGARRDIGGRGRSRSRGGRRSSRRDHDDYDFSDRDLY